MDWETEGSEEVDRPCTLGSSVLVPVAPTEIGRPEMVKRPIQTLISSSVISDQRWRKQGNQGIQGKIDGIPWRYLLYLTLLFQ